MEGVNPVSEVSAFITFHSPATSLLCTTPLATSVYCTLYNTMRPLTCLQGFRPSHWTEMTVELTTVAVTLRGATVAPVEIVYV